ncbi:MAG: serine/threonine-protein kinase [Pseudonocardia sp.]
MQLSTFGPYRIEELLGRGGMGEVYRAHDSETDRQVALKLLPAHLATDKEYRNRFRRECRVAARLNEPHVVPIHRFGEIDGRLYLDMRVVEGTDLGSWLRTNGPMQADIAVAVVGQVAKALDAAHAADLVHRDVKPSNILLTGVTGPDIDISVFAYLVDFGIARTRAGAVKPDEITLTKAGTLPGSPSYVAPERFSGVEGDPRADVYALACVLHQTLTGRAPFEGDLPALIRAHLEAPPPKPSVVRSGVSASLDEIVARGMAKDPEERYQTAGALAMAARAALGMMGSDNLTSSIPVARQETSRPIPSPSTPLPSRTAPPQPGPAATWSRFGPAQPVTAQPSTRVTQDRKAWVTVGIAAAVVIAGGAVVLSMVLTDSRSDNPSTPATAPAQASAAPLTDYDLLIDQLPRGFGAANCTPNPTLRDDVRALAVATCQMGPVEGPETATFTRFASAEQLDVEFEKAVATEDIPAGHGVLEDCRTGASVRQTWKRDDSQAEGGSVACFVQAETREAYLLWSDRDALAFAYVQRRDGNAGTLFGWWNSTDFKR